MNKLLTALMLLFFPALVLADAGNLSFAPPPGDYSVVFLGNLFGIVDGVLHGTGSQIMGAMFAVFNAAVLALGGIIIMYTLMVSTMNTAHEGKMMGEKWSSIWIPVRATMGLALLIPKASGYCLMQIFVMWLVVQGVGAADKIWEAALSYLNRGGVIIKTESTQSMPGLLSTGQSGLQVGAFTMLAGQVCMLGIQKQLEAQKEYLTNLKSASPCDIPACVPDEKHACPKNKKPILCTQTVPDFLGSVNMVVFQNNHPGTSTFAMQMPNFSKDDYPDFYGLNGICGTIKWSSVSQLGDTPAQPGQNNCLGCSGSGCTNCSNGIPLTGAEYQTAQLSRAIAMQQMYMTLATLAQAMINNDPQLVPPNNPGSAGNAPYSPVATQQYGAPYTENNLLCTVFKDKCVSWGLLPSANNAAGVLFSGTEFLGAMNDYNGIMAPTNNLIAASADTATANNTRAFIDKATSQGWLMAGAYFMDLVKLNGNAENKQGAVENNGMEASIFTTADLSDACSNKYAFLCDMLGTDPESKILAIQALIDGTGVPNSDSKALPAPITSDDKTTMDRKAVTEANSATAYGFMNNSVMIQLPGQPGLEKLTFDKVLTITVDTTPMKMKKAKFDCGKVVIIVFKFCLGWLLGNLFYNILFLNFYNGMMFLIQNVIQQISMVFLMIPLQGMSWIFRQGITTLSKPGVNPIVAMANMGVQYINFSAELWLMMIGKAIACAMIPIFGPIIFAFLSIGMPIIMSWIGIMTAIGFTTAYYTPLLPYMMFLFGTIAWLMVVIEAMVAAPVVALGVTHPEGHEAFGKGEPAIMILLNVFLRPAMMIIGYIAAIALSYVGVWILNASFDHAVSIFQGGPDATQPGGGGGGYGHKNSFAGGAYGSDENAFVGKKEQGSGSGLTRYTGWAGIYAFFFSILSYTTIYMIIVQQAFSMISILPDKILRWIGGTPEQLGQESSRWGDQLKSAGEGAAKESQAAQGQIGKQQAAKMMKGVESAKQAIEDYTGGAGETTGGGGAPPEAGGGGGGAGGGAGGGQGSAAQSSSSGSGGGGALLGGAESGAGGGAGKSSRKSPGPTPKI
ncbi:MAG: type IVB secretion system protein DotA [Legionella sp.]|jgi:defect-in-organelle-trafficking protein DotA